MKQRDQKASSLQAASILDAMKEGVFVLNPSGNLVYLNASAAELIGCPKDQALGRPVNEFFPLPGGAGEFWDRVRFSGELDQLEVINQNGESQTFSISAKTLANSGDRLMVIRDVTEAGAAQRLRSYFLANVSHEFRTPLAALSASVELLLEDIENLSQAEIVHLLHSIHYSVTGLQTLIDNLLESTSIESGHFQIRRAWFQLDVLVEQASSVMAPLLRRREQVLTTRLPKQPVEVFVDPTRLGQVFVNLISNASKYSPLGTQIYLEAEVLPEGNLKVRVTDQGPGLSAYDREHLFRRFARSSENSDIQYGAGLGLFVVKAIVEAHGGKVGVDSQPGRGSTFWFELPGGGA